MPLTVQPVAQVMEQLAPKALAEEWDNVGLQLGYYQMPVRKILVTLSITEALVKRAVTENVNLIVAHHPLIFQPLKNILTNTPLGRSLARLIKDDIAVYVSHTNLDHASNGLNTWLAEDLGLDATTVLAPLDDTLETGLGRVGLSEPISVEALAGQIGRRWDTPVRISGDRRKQCRKIAVCGGSGGRLVRKAFSAGADVFITGDVDYHQALEASQLGLAIIDAGHFGTEKIMLKQTANYLEQELSDEIVEVIQALDGDDPWQQL